MLRSIFLFLFLSGVLITKAQDKRELFRGGMFLHSGFVANQVDYPQVEGLVTGIGGKIAFRLGNHFRLGTEGYATNVGYDNNDGQYKLGWGGIVTEFQFTDKRLAPVAGLTLGGGKIRDLYLTKGNFTDNAPDEAIYKIYSTPIIAPHFSLEYRLTESINFVGKIDYLLYPVKKYPDYIASGTRIYFGILFMR